MKFVDSLQEPRAEAMARYSVFDTWFNRDANAATEWMKAHVADLPEDQRGHFIDKLTERDPIAAAAWAQFQPDAKIAVSAMKRSASELYQKSPADALAWLATLPPGDARDAAVNVLASAPVRGPEFDFAAAMQMANFLPAGKPRSEQTLKVLDRWRYVDAKAAQAWLSSAQAGPMLGADGLLKARDVLGKPVRKFSPGNLTVVDELGTWEPNAVPNERWRIGNREVTVYY
jgi:hypothetical protein